MQPIRISPDPVTPDIPSLGIYLAPDNLGRWLLKYIYMVLLTWVDTTTAPGRGVPLQKS